MQCGFQIRQQFLACPGFLLHLCLTLLAFGITARIDLVQGIAKTDKQLLMARFGQLNAVRFFIPALLELACLGEGLTQVDDIDYVQSRRHQSVTTFRFSGDIRGDTFLQPAHQGTKSRLQLTLVLRSSTFRLQPVFAYRLDFFL